MRQNEWVQTYYTVKIFIDVNTVSINVIWWYKTISISPVRFHLYHTQHHSCAVARHSSIFLILFLSFVLSPRFSSLRFSILPTNDEFILFLSLSLSLFFFYSFFLFFFFKLHSLSKLLRAEAIRKLLKRLHTVRRNFSLQRWKRVCCLHE